MTKSLFWTNVCAEEVIGGKMMKYDAIVYYEGQQLILSKEILEHAHALEETELSPEQFELAMELTRARDLLTMELRRIFDPSTVDTDSLSAERQELYTLRTRRNHQ